MPTVVVGTAGHIDHGKTSLLRALTGIDADRLPEERERGMTLDVGYAHLRLPDGTELDFVDVPGHDRLVGNMLVGAGEIDAALLVVAADDGPRAQTREHVALLDALGIDDGIVAITKIDLVTRERVDEVAAEARALLASTALRGVPIIAVSAQRGDGLERLQRELVALRDRMSDRAPARPAGPLRLAVDRVFAARGRGIVVTGTLRGGLLTPSTALRVEPGARAVRVRELQVHGSPRATHDGGRTALNLAGIEMADIERGSVLTDGPGIEPTDRLLAVMRTSQDARARSDAWPPKEGDHLRLHMGTAQVGAVVGSIQRAGVDLERGPVVAIVRLERPIATFVGDRAVLRRPSPAGVAAGLRVLDPVPPRGLSRRRLAGGRVEALAAAVEQGNADAAVEAMVAIHGALSSARVESVRAALAPEARGDNVRGLPPKGPSLVLAPDVSDALEATAIAAVASHHDGSPLSTGLRLDDLRAVMLADLLRRVSIDRRERPDASAAIDRIIAGLVRRERLVREGDRVGEPGRSPGVSPALAAAMDRLEALLDVPAPPSLFAAARDAGCPPDGVRALEAAGRIVRVEADLAWAAASYRRLAARALAMATRSELTPAAFRDATGTSRKYVLAILEDLDRRGILTRTPTGHVPGPRAPRAAGAISGDRG